MMRWKENATAFLRGKHQDARPELREESEFITQDMEFGCEVSVDVRKC